MAAQNLGRIMWAVDALAEDRALQVKMAKALKVLTQKSATKVEPIYLLSPDQLRLAPSLFAEEQKTLKLAAEKKLNALLKKVTWPNLLPANMLLSPDYSLRMAVQTLLIEARRTKARAIAVSTLARKGVTRFLLGSFAETLILQSDLPVFLVSPHSSIPNRFKEIIYPTDFSDKSNNMFPEVLRLASELGAKVTIFHNVEYYTPYAVDVYASVATYSSFIEKDVARRKKMALELKRTAEEKGIKTDIKVSEKARSTSVAICALAKKLTGSIIVMASQTGPVASSILGSVTREVLRTSSAPMWVIHPIK